MRQLQQQQSAQLETCPACSDHLKKKEQKTQLIAYKKYEMKRLKDWAWIIKIFGQVELYCGDALAWKVDHSSRR